MAATTALTVVSGITNVFSSLSQSSAQKAEGSYQKSIYDTNSKIAEIQAADALKRGETEATNLKTQTKKLIGAQRARLAAQGQDLESGDALDIQEETAGLGSIDALQIKNNAWREAWGYQVQAEDYRSRGVYAEMTGKNKSRSTLLTGGLQVAKGIAQAGYLSSLKGSRDNAVYTEYA